MDNNLPPSSVPEPTETAPVEGTDDLSAGFWLRFGAYTIDGILLVTLGLVLKAILPAPAGMIARLLLGAGYFTLMPVLARGQTVGKMAAGIAIVRNDGSPIGYSRAFARWLGYFLSTLTVGLGFLCAGFTKRKRALHDYLVGTRVVRLEQIVGLRKASVVAIGPILMVLAIATGAFLASRFPPVELQENSLKARLGTLRSATAIYYGDAGGNYPADLNVLIPKYVPQIAPIGTAEHPGASGVEVYGAEVCSGSQEPGQDLIASKLRDTGKWGYVFAPKAPCNGKVFIDCTHMDSKGSTWYSY